jgi:hypothetical protein
MSGRPPTLRSDGPTTTTSRSHVVVATAPVVVPPPPRRRRTALIVTIIVVVVVVLIAAGVLAYFLFFRSSGGGGSTTTSGKTACGTTDDCDSSYVCVSDLCQGITGASCTADNNCASTFSCQDDGAGNKSCIQRPCGQDSDCNVGGLSGLSCDTTNSVCIGPPGTACDSSTECQLPYTCSSTNVCGGDLGGACSSDSDCIVPFFCNSGSCAVKPCTLDANCRIGASCIGATACGISPMGQCHLPDQCQGPSKCTSEFSSTLGFNSCALYGGQTCTGGQQCLSDSCSVVLSVIPTVIGCSCGSDADCASGQTCSNPGSGGTCA